LSGLSKAACLVSNAKTGDEPTQENYGLIRLVLRLACFIVWTSLASGAFANAVSDMRLIGDPERTRFVVDLEKGPKYGLLRLANPYRLVLDLPDVEFMLPAKPGEGRGLVSDYRYGLIAPGKARIVLDLSGPVEVVNTFVLDPVSSEPARLVVDLVPTSAEAFAKAATNDRPQRLAHNATQSPGGPRIDGGLPVVVIDPGHGGIDSGATGKDGLVEKDVTLKFGLELQKQLNAGGKLQAVMTRSGDTFLSLPERVAFAHKSRARLLISIHADTVREKYVRGATVYTLSDDASDELAKQFAERENRSDVLAGLAIEDEPDDVADILVDLAMRETRNFSIRFAKTLVDDMRGKIALNGNPWRRASFKVLKAPEVPSVLLELGYLSNEEDEDLFQSEAWPKEEAKVVSRAIEAFLSRNETAGQ
jgi:N-acetylmuramoyl-L-alanine amidase